MKRFLPAIPAYAPIQRFEKPTPKIYYAPQWRLDKSGQRDENIEKYSPMNNYGVTPDKWEYLNKVVWPPNHVVPETGEPKPREVFHVKESIHIHPKKIFPSCYFAQNMIASEAIKQLRHKQTKPTLLLAETIEEAVEKASDEFKIENPLERMFVAEAFGIQCKIIKSLRRHAKGQWNILRHRYINLHVRLEEGEPPKFKGREPDPNVLFFEMVDSEEIIEEERILTELEKNAIARRQHLLEMRKRFTNKDQNGEENGNEEENGEESKQHFAIQFRSYKPVNVKESKTTEETTNRDEINLINKKVEKQLEAGKDTKIGDSLDINTLAPRKVDWDLRRGIKEKLDKLDRRTNKAINQLIRKRVKEEVEGGNEELIAYAVQDVGKD
ncbi:hypothetical protein Mgra_00007804 [Meloidogyne graminicola]|uniref:39S ribosomal protein L22, mitochondrial n=1 Tax=Meloidogyne graminicola TaxID=189291 RepID=A0A8S9ZHP6_9BILA|nr:hypothetical protein Mgra_00007804 [Meloidogyne graminicola]